MIKNLFQRRRRRGNASKWSPPNMDPLLHKLQSPCPGRPNNNNNNIYNDDIKSNKK